MHSQNMHLRSAGPTPSRPRRATTEGTDVTGPPASIGIVTLLRVGAGAVCALLVVGLLACGGGGQPTMEPEAKASPLEGSVESVDEETVGAKDEMGVADEGRDEQQDAQPQGSEKAPESKTKPVDAYKEEWGLSKSDSPSLPRGDVLERTAALAEEAGGTVHFIDHPGRGDRSVLVTPREFVDGETPLIVSLHGYGGNSADLLSYAPLHRQVNSRGFGLLLPTGSLDAEGSPFWNPTDHCCDGGKTGEDDAAYLTDLVAEANKLKEFGPVYLFGYSNGGFMAHHMACKGLPGLRAVASVAGTSYVDDASCQGAGAGVSVANPWHSGRRYPVRGRRKRAPARRAEGSGRSTLGLGTSRCAGAGWPGATGRKPPSLTALWIWTNSRLGPRPRHTVWKPDAPRVLTLELWVGEGSGHAPGYGDVFVDALLDWLLSQD